MECLINNKTRTFEIRLSNGKLLAEGSVIGAGTQNDADHLLLSFFYGYKKGFYESYFR